MGISSKLNFAEDEDGGVGMGSNALGLIGISSKETGVFFKLIMGVGFSPLSSS